MLPLVLALAGVAALAAGLVLLRRLGPRLRVGRILATTRIVPVAEARAMVGRPRYVGVRGRIDSADEFHDEHHRPLVYKRTRLEARRGERWIPFEDDRRVVDFEVGEGLDSIRVDGDRLDEGLVVVSRESVGTAADLGDRAPADLAPDHPVRLRIEQLSSVEHAVVLGVPVADADGGVALTAGLGRPLVVTTLETPEALRLLGGGRSGPARLAALLLAAGLALIAIALVAALASVVLSAVVPPAVLAAEPSPTPAAGGDPRSSGSGPGLVGEPFVAIGAVLGIGLAMTAATLVYVRLTDGTRSAGHVGTGGDRAAGLGTSAADPERPITRR